jgi:hypothetical protein
VYTDPQSAFRSLTGSFPGVLIDIGGAKDNVAKVDAKIRRIKELYRSVKESLPWTIPKSLVRDLVAYAVSRLNIRHTTAINLNVCPTVLFSGVKVNYKKELELGFGDYAEVYDGTDNTATSRSVPCIALYPCHNSTGSWEFMNLKTKKRIRRSQWTKMVTTENIIDIMNFFEDEKENPLATVQLPLEEEPHALQPVLDVETPEPPQEEVQVQQLIPEEQEDSDDLVDAPNEDSDSEDEDDDDDDEDKGIASRTRQRTGTSIL